MKLLSVYCTTFLLSILLAFGQSVAPPQAIHYSSIIRDFQGHAMINQPVSLQFSIHSDSLNGPVVYQEIHNVTTNQWGVANLDIGRGIVGSGVFANIDWGNHEFFLEVELDINSGVNFKPMGTVQFLSVPYALYAKTAGNVVGGGAAVSYPLHYPQGYNGTPVAFALDTNISYTVPPDKNLYLATCGYTIAINGVVYATQGSCPMFGPNTTFNALDLHGCTGLLMDTTSAITPVHFILDDAVNTFTVPAGKKLIIRSGIGYGISSLTANGVPYTNFSEGGGDAWIFPSGTVLNTLFSVPGGFTGYLADQ